MNGPLVDAGNGEKSPNERKADALIGIAESKGVQPRWLIAHRAGISHDTLERWEKEDPQFKRDLTNILNDQKAKEFDEAHLGLSQGLRRGDSATVRAALAVIYPERWSDRPQEKPVEKVYLLGVWGEPRKMIDAETKEVTDENNKKSE